MTQLDPTGSQESPPSAGREGDQSDKHGSELQSQPSLTQTLSHVIFTDTERILLSNPPLRHEEVKPREHSPERSQDGKDHVPPRVTQGEVSRSTRAGHSRCRQESLETWGQDRVQGETEGVVGTIPLKSKSDTCGLSPQTLPSLPVTRGKNQSLDHVTRSYVIQPPATSALTRTTASLLSCTASLRYPAGAKDTLPPPVPFRPTVLFHQISAELTPQCPNGISAEASLTRPA